MGGGAALGQRVIKGVASGVCFLACLAAFFSLGVIAGCFLVSLLNVKRRRLTLFY